MFVCLGAVVIGCVIGYVLHTHIIGWFMQTVPNDVLKSQDETLYTFTPAESFLTCSGSRSTSASCSRCR